MADEKENKTKKQITLKVEKIYDNSPLPIKPKTNSDSGYDVCAHNVSRIYAHYGSNNEKCLMGDDMEPKFISSGVLELQSGERVLIGTGLKMTVGEGYELQVRPRRGIALKRGLTIVNAPGTIDADYRGEVGIIILNTSRQTQRITLGEKIAQIVPMKVELLDIEEVKLPEDTKRNSDGYGSTSRREKFNMPEAIITNAYNKTTPFNQM